MERKITEESLQSYTDYLYEEEKSQRTIEKYLCDMRKLMAYMGDRELTKRSMVEYKTYLKDERNYRTSSINSFLVAANRFFEYMQWYDLKVKTYRIQKQSFAPEEKELTKEEFKKLVLTAEAQGKERLAGIILTICATGIRVGELEAITVDAVKYGSATIYNKGKERKILLTRDLQVKLLRYIRKQGIKTGPVFQTRRGRAVGRSSIWRDMKKLCQKAGVDPGKVFPHNLRHLFAKTFHKIDNDLAILADILGHSSIETTRLYIRTTCAEYREKLDNMRLLVGL